jgi:chemotaxis receptor (MCP) glutamine deamidase CheD
MAAMNTIPFDTQYASLDTGDWKTPDELGIHGAEGKFISGEMSCVTDATSRYPVIATKGVDVCTAVILYDPDHHIAAVAHYEQWDSETLDALLALFPDSTRLEAHVVGAFYFGAKDNHFNINNKEAIFERLESDPRISIKTVDIYPKSRPRDVGIDSRTGQLIRGSRLYGPSEECRSFSEDPSIFSRANGWGAAADPSDMLAFDGRTEQYRRSNCAIIA